MNLDKVTAELRPRGPWEAADFGARMIRRDAGPIYRVWFAVTLPLLLLALLGVLYTPWPGLVVFLYWWLEPVADGPMLHIISRRLFGEAPDVRGALREVPALAKRNWIFLLSPYRFHFARSTAMPVTQLEGVKASQRRARAKVLNQVNLNYGIGVTAAYQHLALAVYFGVVLIVFAFIPVEYQGSTGLDWLTQMWEGEGRNASLLNLVLVYAAQTALQPWFVGAGFGLYINCRTQLEAWDIEVAFRRMAERRARRVAAAGLVVLGVVLLSGPLSGDALADEEAQQQQSGRPDPGFDGFWTDEQVGPALETVFASDELMTSEEFSEWRKIETDEEQVESPRWEGLAMFFIMLGKVFSFIAEFALWFLAGILVLAIILLRDRWLPYLNTGSRKTRKQRRVILASGEITAESLPEDVPKTVLDLWRSGQRRDAMSLLYRASVFAVVTRHGVRIPASATERVCIDAVNAQAGGSPATYFSKVVAAWSWCAYASRAPADDVVTALCAEWSGHFGARA
jgi:hypothetical protein